MAFRSNIHMDSRVMEVAGFKSEAIFIALLLATLIGPLPSCFWYWQHCVAAFIPVSSSLPFSGHIKLASPVSLLLEHDGFKLAVVLLNDVQSLLVHNGDLLLGDAQDVPRGQELDGRCKRLN